MGVSAQWLALGLAGWWVEAGEPTGTLAWAEPADCIAASLPAEDCEPRVAADGSAVELAVVPRQGVQRVPEALDGLRVVAERGLSSVALNVSVRARGGVGSPLDVALGLGVDGAHDDAVRLAAVRLLRDPRVVEALGTREVSVHGPDGARTRLQGPVDWVEWVEGLRTRRESIWRGALPRREGAWLLVGDLPCPPPGAEAWASRPARGGCAGGAAQALDDASGLARWLRDLPRSPAPVHRLSVTLPRGAAGRPWSLAVLHGPDPLRTTLHPPRWVAGPSSGGLVRLAHVLALATGLGVALRALRAAWLAWVLVGKRGTPGGPGGAGRR